MNLLSYDPASIRTTFALIWFQPLACFRNMPGLRAFALAVSLAFDIISPDGLLAHILTSHKPLLECCLLWGAFPDFPVYQCTSAPLNRHIPMLQMLLPYCIFLPIP